MHRGGQRLRKIHAAAGAAGTADTPVRRDLAGTGAASGRHWVSASANPGPAGLPRHRVRGGSLRLPEPAGHPYLLFRRPEVRGGDEHGQAGDPGAERQKLPGPLRRPAAAGAAGPGTVRGTAAADPGRAHYRPGPGGGPGPVQDPGLSQRAGGHGRGDGDPRHESGFAERPHGAAHRPRPLFSGHGPGISRLSQGRRFREEIL